MKKRSIHKKKNKYNIPAKQSISFKIPLCIVVVMIVAVILAGVFSNLFMERFYTANKRVAIKRIYRQISRMTKKDEYLIGDQSKIKINDLCEKYGAAMAYINTDGQIIYIYGSDDRLTRRWKDSVFSIGGSVNFTSKEIEKNDKYSLTYTTDMQTSNHYYELVSSDDEGRDLVIRLSVENFKDSISIANRFYFVLALVFILIITIILVIITRSYTLPILALADLSKKMSRLDFDAKYTGPHNDEIGILGDSMNEMSDRLEETITELKNANVKLHQDIKKKEEIDEMRKEFISNISHELKTPIALIQGYAEGLKDGINESPEDAEYYCDVIMDEAIKMNKMVLSLLSLNQIEFGNTKLNIERFDVIQVIKAVVNRMSMLADKNDVTVELDSDDKVFVYADEFMTEEVITNYLSNAFNHVDDNKTIKISVTNINDKVRVSVYNSGANIPDQDIDRVWEKFYKVDKARTRAYGGTGIGLSIVKAVMEGHNNKYGVLNKEGGVEFFFELDAVK